MYKRQVVSCGGGGSNTVETLESDNTDIPNDSIDMPEASVADTGDPDNETSDIEPSNNGQSDNDLDDEDMVSEQVESPLLLFVSDGPAQGIAGGRIEEFKVESINAAGFGVISAQITGAASGSALWSIKPDGIQLIWRTGDPLTSEVGSAEFSSLIDSSVSNSGEMAFVVRTEDGGKALLSVSQGQAALLLSGGDESVGPYDTALDGPAIIDNLLAVRRSNTDLYVLVQFEGSVADSVWLQQTTAGFDQVIRASTGFVSSNLSLSVALASDPECRLYTRASGGAFFAIDDGSVLINGRRLCGAASGDAVEVIARRDITGAWAVVDAVDGSAPVAPESTFDSIAWHSVDTVTGDAIVVARVITVDGTSRGQTDVGWWSYEAEGEVRLLLLEGEEIQVGTEIVSLPSSGGSSLTSPVVRVRQGRAAVWFGNEDNRNIQTVLAAGVPHDSAQPHASLAVPGASSLTTLAATGLPGPQGQEVQSRFSSLSLPMLAANGDIWFTGTLLNATTGGQSRSALWKADTNGTIAHALTAGDSVFISGVETTVLGFDRLFLDAGLEPGFVTDAGDIYLLVEVVGGFSGGDALLKIQVNSGM